MYVEHQLGLVSQLCESLFIISSNIICLNLHGSVARQTIAEAWLDNTWLIKYKHAHTTHTHTQEQKRLRMEAWQTVKSNEARVRVGPTFRLYLPLHQWCLNRGAERQVNQSQRSTARAPRRGGPASAVGSFFSSRIRPNVRGLHGRQREKGHVEWQTKTTSGLHTHYCSTVCTVHTLRTYLCNTYDGVRAQPLTYY